MAVTAVSLPAGYSLLPAGIRCRCVRMQSSGGQYFCCGGRAEQDTSIRDQVQKVEALARAMCTADGNDPDRKVFNVPLQRMSGYPSQFNILPENLYLVDAWTVYAGLAAAALEHLAQESA